MLSRLFRHRRLRVFHFVVTMQGGRVATALYRMKGKPTGGTLETVRAEVAAHHQVPTEHLVITFFAELEN